MIPWIERGSSQPFPPVSQAFVRPNGLLAAGADLSPPRLLDAYRAGIFPWYSPGEPTLWWSPDPRLVIEPARIHVPRRLRRTVRSGQFELTLDKDFNAVVTACAAPRPGQPGTWITGEMKTAFGVLHELGHAHSLEVWQAGELVGGIYGLAMGQVFFGESMFRRRRDCSKIALVALCELLAVNGGQLLDCQVESDHLRRLGAIALPRADFCDLLGRLTTAPGFDWQAPALPIQWAPFFHC